MYDRTLLTTEAAQVPCSAKKRRADQGLSVQPARYRDALTAKMEKLPCTSVSAHGYRALQCGCSRPFPISSSCSTATIQFTGCQSLGSSTGDRAPIRLTLDTLAATMMTGNRAGCGLSSICLRKTQTVVFPFDREWRQASTLSWSELSEND